jgi:cholesterol transport system auxiliary component
MLSACSILFKPAIVPQINTYTLDPSPVNIVNGKKTDLSILVQVPNMNPGFSTQRMVYLTKDFHIGYYTQNEWVGTPGEMLQPLISQALQLTGHYAAVVVPPYANFMDLELNTRVLSFYQDFRTKPSHIHLRIVVQLLDRKTNTIIATHDFIINQAAEEDTPYGGVTAANKAVAAFLTQLTEFCVNAKSR